MEHEEIRIEYENYKNRGHMYLNAEVFFPCSAKNMRFILNKVIPLASWENQEKIISQIEDHLKRGIAETEEYKKILPSLYQETKKHIPELEEKVHSCERLIERIKEAKQYTQDKNRKKELSEVLKKEKEKLQFSKAHLKDAEATCKGYVRKMEQSIKRIERYKDNLKILQQRK